MITHELTPSYAMASGRNRPVRFEYVLGGLFGTPTMRGEAVLSGLGIRRDLDLGLEPAELLLDSFNKDHAQCAFLRLPISAGDEARFRLNGAYVVQSSLAGGWLLRSEEASFPVFWLPRWPVIRQLDNDQHVLKEIAAEIVAIHASSAGVEVTVKAPATGVLDTVFWRFAPESGLAAEFDQWRVLELQAYFMWSSHTLYRRPSDLYLHLVHGHVYENHAVWPRYWTVCSELDAHSLYVTLRGLESATGKRFYNLLKRQVVLSVMARQSTDGGWYHGEWTDVMEAHYRLHCGAIHLLCEALEEESDAVIHASLKKAVDYCIERRTTIIAGTWFLHDSLELNPEAVKLYPFPWAKSQVLGKSVSNMLVFPTHLDTTLALDRYSQVTGDTQYADIVNSAVSSARFVIGLRTAEWLYRPLFWIIGLTFLPKEMATALPWPLRAIKRIGWKYIIPKLHLLKARFPRFMMPGGFIDRSIVQSGCPVRYHPVNLMDLVRFDHRFGGCETELQAGFTFTRDSHLRLRWKEERGQEDDSLGFWAEALYARCLTHPDPKYRAWLAEAVLDLEDNGLGLSPSLLGARAETARSNGPLPCPGPATADLRVVNLGRGEHHEILVVNTAQHPVPLVWETPHVSPLIWKTGEGTLHQGGEEPLVIPPRSWLWGESLPSKTKTAY